MKGAALDRFLLRKQGRHWDGVLTPGFTVADLSPSALANFRKKAAKSKRLSAELLAESDPVLLEKLKLTEHDYLKRAAVMLFHEDPECIVTGAYVKIGYFRTDSDLLYHDEIHGDLFSQVEKTVDLLLTKYLRAGISYEGVQRVEAFPVPEPALREAVINAIVHKDYASAIPIQISVYHNKLMIWNAGQLPDDWTIESLLAKHASAPSNPDLANTFFRVAFMESWGRGIDLIRNACRAAGNPEPAFRWDNGLWVEFGLQGTGTEAEVTGEMTGEVTGKVTGKTPVEVVGKAPAQILNLLQESPYLTVPEISRRISKSESTVQRGLRKLQDAGRLKRIGPDKGGHWEVQQ